MWYIIRNSLELEDLTNSWEERMSIFNNVRQVLEKVCEVLENKGTHEEAFRAMC